MAHLNFSWDPSPTPGVESYNLYEDGIKIVPDIGVLNFSLLMDGKPNGEYSYYVTAQIGSQESVPSNTVTANFIVPEAPLNLEASFGD